MFCPKCYHEAELVPWHDKAFLQIHEVPRANHGHPIVGLASAGYGLYKLFKKEQYKCTKCDHRWNVSR